MPAVTTTDPKWVAPESHSALEAAFLPLMRDERDLIFIRVCAMMTVTVLPAAAALFLFAEPWLAFAVAPVYIGALFLAYGGRYGLMLHATGHRPIFKREHLWIQNYIPFVLGPFMGHTPTSFAAHHMWMHHAENNMFADHSCTLPYKRDSLPHFLHYFLRFFLLGQPHLIRYLTLRGRNRIALRFLLGELSWFVLVGVALWLNWAAALVVFVLPLLFMRFLLMAGNWAQHAFVDLDDPDNGFKNSSNLTNTSYNHLAYNDGYHIVHHEKPAMHWTEMAKYYEDNQQLFADADSIVFDGILDNLFLWVLLMGQRYDMLARHLVDFHGRSHAEKVAFLQGRARRQQGRIPGIFAFETAESVARTARVSTIPVEQALAAE
ncbi:MAG: fatty acid desaturase [Myxococcota bacterium]|jgi:fatty acid desaturase